MTGTEILVTSGGAALIGALAYFFFGPKQAGRADVRDGFQEVEITVKGGYSPSVIKVQEGVPLRLVFDRQERGECTSEVVFPDFRIRRNLPAFTQTTVDLTPQRSGQFGFACGMNMVHGMLLVESAEADGDPSGTSRPLGTQTSRRKSDRIGERRTYALGEADRRDGAGR